MIVNNIGAIILAGGASERMNYPKSFLFYRSKTFLQTIVETYMHTGITNIVAVINKNICAGNWRKFLQPLKSTIAIAENPDPELGRFNSLKLGAEKMINMDFCFIQNVDSPFITSETLKKIMKGKNSQEYAVPVFKGKGGHPILVSKKIIRGINRMDRRDINLKNFLQTFTRHEIEMEGDEVLININTPEDYKQMVQGRQMA